MSADHCLSEAKRVLHLATNYDTNQNFTLAIKNYLDGVDFLRQYINLTKETTDVSKIRDKIEGYISRVEALKPKERTVQKYESVIQRNIEEDSTGHSYENIFKDALNEKIRTVEIEEPYLEAYHQQMNFVRFCELLVVHAPRLKTILLITKKPINKKEEFKTFVKGIIGSLRMRNIELTIQEREIHDREIRFDNGWKVKMGRGLDIYKIVDKFSIGAFDLNMRPCKKCTVELYRPKD